MRETFAPCLAALLAALCGCRADPDTPLTKAAAAGDAAQVRTVVAGGADVNGMDSRGWAAVHWAARNGELHVLEALIEAGGDVDLKDGGNGWTPLMHAIHKNQVAAARRLLEAGADPNVKTAGGVTSLIMATIIWYSVSSLSKR